MSVRLIYGDCLKVMPTLLANTVQIVIADLPYASTQCHWDSLIDPENMFSLFERVATGSAAYIFTANIRLASRLIAARPNLFRYDLVWHKSRLTGHLSARHRPLRAHELILIFSKNKTIYNPQMRKNVSGRKGIFRQGAATTSCYGADARQSMHKLGQPLFPISVVSFAAPTADRGMHPTQKPVALIEWILKTYSQEGDTVLDPVAGSGTTAIAALRTGRNAICIEKDAGYYDVMCRRVEAEQAALVAS